MTLSFLCAACASSVTRPATPDDFSRVSVMERRLDIARTGAEDSRRSCAARRASADDAAAASGAICRVADDALDADLIRRCTDARRLAAGAVAASRGCAEETSGD